MLDRALLTTIVLAVSVSMTAAKDQQKKEECPTLNLGEIEELVRKSELQRRWTLRSRTNCLSPPMR